MRFLIDGYNMMHAAGWLPTGPVASLLEKKRAEFVAWLATHHPEPSRVCVVFDAKHAPRRGREEQLANGGLQVVFAYRAFADDAIEDRIAHDAAPKQLAVVSNDRRLQEAARRRGCRVLPCAEFLDWIHDPPSKPIEAPRVSPSKPEQPTREELDEFLIAFREADLLAKKRDRR